MAISGESARRVALDFAIRELEAIQSSGLGERLPEPWPADDVTEIADELKRVIRNLKRQLLDAEEAEQDAQEMQAKPSRRTLH